MSDPIGRVMRQINMECFIHRTDSTSTVSEQGLNGRFDCDECEYKVVSKGNLDNHKEFVHEVVKYDCEQCGTSFSKMGLVTHLKYTHGEFKFFCDQCEYKYKKRFLLRLLIESTHNGVKFKLLVFNRLKLVYHIQSWYIKMLGSNCNSG